MGSGEFKFDSLLILGFAFFFFFFFEIIKERARIRAEVTDRANCQGGIK